MPKPIYINGKFYSAGLNGVHRVADRLIHEVDRLVAALPEPDRPRVELFVPRRRCWSLELQAVKVVEHGFPNGQVWEQLLLPLRTRDGVLVNLCNLAPLVHLNKVTMIHDAQYLMSDSSYPGRTRWLYRLFSPAIARSSRLVVTVSDYSRHVLDLLKVADRDRVMVIPNGADHLLGLAEDASVLDDHGLRGGAFVAHIASPKAYKNTKIVLEAFRSPRLRPLKLVLAGAGREELAAVGLQVPPEVVCVGKVSDPQLAALYRAAVCMAFPSRTEGFGLPPAEAMSLGCPAVVAPSGAIPEVCGDAVLYAGVDDAEAWTEAFLRLHEDPDLRAAKIEAGSARTARMTWAASGRALATELLRLAGGLQSPEATSDEDALQAFPQRAIG